MSAMSVQHACPETSLPSQATRGEELFGLTFVDVAKAHEAALLVGYLDPDGLLAGDRREDPDVSRRQRVRQVILERCDLRDLRPGGELELIAAHVRAGDHADHPRVDAEVLERLQERLRRRLAVLGVGPRVSLALREHVRVGRRVVGLIGDRDPVLGPLVPHGRQLDRLVDRIRVRVALAKDRNRLWDGLPRLRVVRVRLVVREGALAARGPCLGDWLFLVLGFLPLGLVRENLRFVRASDLDVHVVRLVPAGKRRREAVVPGGAGDVCRCARCAARRNARALDEVRDRHARQEQDAREKQKDCEDLRAHPLKERRRSPIERFADGATVAAEEVGLEVARDVPACRVQGQACRPRTPTGARASPVSRQCSARAAPGSSGGRSGRGRDQRPQVE